jgi:hypothetical protein
MTDLVLATAALVAAAAALTLALAMPKLLARQKAKYDRMAEEDLRRFGEDVQP